MGFDSSVQNHISLSCFLKVVRSLGMDNKSGIPSPPLGLLQVELFWGSVEGMFSQLKSLKYLHFVGPLDIQY